MSEIIKFPCDFPVKIIGSNSDEFIIEIVEIVSKHFPDFDKSNLQHKPSKNGNYLGITVTVIATSQETLDAFYQDINKHPQVKMVL